MRKPKDPKELAVAILLRSTCIVQVGAVLADRWGIHSWGHNHAGPTGMGQCAEQHCLLRANRRRLQGSILFVAARRLRTGRIVQARPCKACWRAIAGRVAGVHWRDGSGVWQRA